MVSTETLQGIKLRWKLSRKLGEGDAGEVWLATSEKDGHVAVVKRPVQRAFVTDIQRQASQIRFEGDALEGLKSLSISFADCTVRAVELYDRSREEDENGARAFLVLEKARGFDIETLLKYRLSGISGEIENSKDREFLEYFCRATAFSRLLMLRAIGGLAAYLPQIHRRALTLRGQPYSGLVWNDVKINHLFWDPSQSVLTIIDFGNAQPLTSDGVSPDRRYSAAADARQFCEEMQRFAQRAAPDFATRLFTGQDCGKMSSADLNDIRRAAEREAQTELMSLQSARQREKQLLTSGIQKANREELNKIRQQIFMYAEIPDYATQQRQAQTAFEQAIRTLNFGLWEESLESGGAPSALLAEFAIVLRPLSRELGAEDREKLKIVCSQALERRWEDAFWELHRIGSQESENWRAVRQFLRRQVPDLTPQTPYQVLQEFLKELSEISDARVEELRGILQGWQRQEPIKGKTYFDYPEEYALKQLFQHEPARWQRLNAALLQAKQAAGVVDDAWRGAQFERARAANLRWLLRDPERTMIFSAKYWLSESIVWQQQIQQKFTLTDAKKLHQTARNLRQLLGDTPWLTETHEDILEAFSNGESFDRIKSKYREAERYFPQYAQSEGEPEWDEDLRTEYEAFYDNLRQRDTEEAQKVLDNSPLKQLPGYRALLTAFADPFKQQNLPERKSFHSKDQTAETALNLLKEIATLTGQKPCDLKQIFEEWEILKGTYNGWALAGGIFADISAAFQTSGFLQAADNIQDKKWDVPLDTNADKNLKNMMQALRKAQETWQDFVEADTKDKQQKFKEICKQAAQAKTAWQDWQNKEAAKSSSAFLKNLLKNAKQQNSIDKFFENLDNWLKAVQSGYTQLRSGKRRNLDTTAQTFLNNVGQVEQLLTGAKQTTPTWLEAFRTRKQDALAATHPLHEWYASRPTKIPDVRQPNQWRWDPNFGFGVLVTVLTFCCIAVLIGLMSLIAPRAPGEIGNGLPTLMHSPTPRTTGANPNPIESLPSATPSSTPTLTPSETATPTPTPAPSETPLPTATLISDRCNEFAGWAAQRNWEVYQKNLDEISEETYEALAPHCGWDAPTKKQAHRDAELLGILQTIANGKLNLAHRLLEKLTQSFFKIEQEDFALKKDPAELAAYAHWLRASLALCRAAPRTKLQAETLLAYWEWHQQQYPQIVPPTKMDVLCEQPFGETLQGWRSVVTRTQTQSLLSLPDWPPFVRDAASGSLMPGNCAHVGDNKSAHWWFSPDQPECTLPPMIAALQPNWAEVSALEIALTRIKDSGIPKTLVWNLPRNNVTTTLRFEQSEQGEVKNWQIEADFVQAEPPIVIASGTFSPTLQFSTPTYLNLQVVSVGRMLFWRVNSQPNPAEASSLRLLPALAVVLPPQNSLLEPQRVEFSLGGTTAELPVHLYINRLQLLK